MRMRQISFASAEHQGKKRVTRREKFLGEMEQVVPWSRLLAALEPHYPRGTRGRPPIGLERMLRLYFVQQWYALSDEGLEDAVSDSAAIRQFIGIDLGHEEAPDATTVLKFRRLLEAHKLTAVLLEEINAHLRERGLMMREGTMVDATLINAPTSTKNRDKARDPEMHQTKKRNQGYKGIRPPWALTLSRAWCTAHTTRRPTSLMWHTPMRCCMVKRITCFSMRVTRGCTSA